MTLLATCTDILWLHYSCTIIFAPLKQLMLSRSDNYRNTVASPATGIDSASSGGSSVGGYVAYVITNKGPHGVNKLVDKSV